MIEYFDVPKEALSIIKLMLTENEMILIDAMENNEYTYDDLLELIKEKLDVDPGDFIRDTYKRGVINKVDHDGEIMYKSSDVYTRLAFFAQYEIDLWKSIPKADRENLDRWYVKRYAEGALPRLKEIQEGKRRLIENAHFYTLEETLDLIDGIEEQMYVVPCNCKSVALKCEKPKNVCILFEHDINSSWDRGWGESIDKEEAKEIVKMANENGLMHTSEAEHAICNCDGCCCYPIRASEIIGTKGIWPEKLYNIVWNQEKCVNCGLCAKICNFEAFTKMDKKVVFDEEKCWGCTICKNHCPVGAITLEKVEG